MKIIMDFETMNPTVKLRDVGTEAYAMHPDTTVLCLCYRREDGDLHGTWTPGEDTWALLELIYNDDYTFEAHNAAFEQMVWKYKMMPLGLPEIPIARWSCSMATALYHGLPGALDKGATMMGLDEGKDKEGSALTVSLSKKMTKKDLTQYGTPENRTAAHMPRVISYCQSDCRVEANLSAALGPLSGYERKVWELDQVINHRGLRLDTGFIAAARRVVAGATEEMTIEFHKLTDGLEPTQVARIKEWLAAQGYPLDSLNKATLAQYGIGVDDEEGDDDGEEYEGPIRDLPPNVYRALEIRAMLGAASIKKLPKMQASIGEGGRSRYLVQYYGAHTGRWAGRIWQPHNLPRGLITVRNDKGKLVPPDPEQLRQIIMTGDHRFVAEVYGDAIRAVATNLRSAVIPSPGHIFFDGDFSGIEARTVLTCAGQFDKTNLMASGADVYLDMACDIYGAAKGSLTKDDVEKRTIGKNTVLGCGFGMGAGTFRARYCPNAEEGFAEKVITAYREDWAPKVPELWDAWNFAAMKAVYGEVVVSHAMRFVKEDCWLKVCLPDGQVMHYAHPALEENRFGGNGWKYMLNGHGQRHEGSPGTPGYGTHSQKIKWSVPDETKQKDRWVHMYGGAVTENLVQKLARGFLCEAMFRLEQHNMPVVMHVHDSILVEVPEKGADFQAFKDIMTADPHVVREGIYPVPIAIEGYQADRWRK